jgi:hypothetical protein
MKIIRAEVVGYLVSQYLRMPSDFINRLEGQAELARHVASFECPCSERRLVGSITAYLRDHLPADPFAGNPGLYREQAEKLVSGLLVHGDLIEIEDAESGSGLLALRAPAVCALSKNMVIVLGIAPLGSDSLPEKYRTERKLKGYARILTIETATSVLNDLRAVGYVIISETEWAQIPEQLSARLHVASYTARFRTDTTVGQIEGLRVLDTERPATHYNSRWVSPAIHDGDFIARRQKKYGNEGWAFVRLRDLEAVSLLDLPTRNFPFRACDEAWHLQQAIDHEAGRPQRYRVIHSTNSEVGLQFFSPIPQWAHRRLTSLGDQVEATNCLLEYRFPTAKTADGEIKFVETRMWLAPL